MKRYIVIIALLFSNCLWAQWTHLGPHSDATSGFNPEQVDAIAIDPANPLNCYLGSRGGLWMSSNDAPTSGQATWTLMDPTNIMYYGGASAIAVDPSTSKPGQLGNVYVASSDIDLQKTYGIYEVQNPFGTPTWTLLPAFPVTCYIHNLQFHPSLQGYLYACTSAGLYVSTNYGTSWTQAYATETYNVAFVPDGSTTYCFATGSGIFLESTNGTTFTNNTSIASYLNTDVLLNSYTETMANICVGDLSTPSKYMYIHEMVQGSTEYMVNNFDYSYTSNISHEVYQLYEQGGTVYVTTNSFGIRNASGNPVNSSGNPVNYSTGNSNHTPYFSFDPNLYDARLAIGYTSNGLLICGSVDVCAMDTKNTVYLSVGIYHSDNHAVADLPNVKTVLLGNDGGLLSCNYTGYTNGASLSFSLSSLGLDISQVTGFSGTQDENNIYLMGDQDALNGWEYNNTSDVVKSTQGSTEPKGGIVNRSDNQEMIMNTSDYTSTYGVTENGEATTPTWDYTPLDPPSDTDNNNCFGNFGIPVYGPVNPSSKFEANISNKDVFCDQTGFGKNLFYQDPSPSRANVIYYGTSMLDQWDPVNKVFAGKVRAYELNYNPTTGATYTSGTPGFIDWQCFAYSIGVSPIYKNALYFVTFNRDYPQGSSPEQCFPHLITYTGGIGGNVTNNWDGSNIDNAWVGNNEENLTYWNLMTPTFASVYPQYSFGTNDTAYDQILLNSVVVSNWNPSKVWVGCNAVNYPAIKVMQYDNGTWTDYSTGIPPTENVWSMEIEIGSNDGIYLGTNRAIYYRNATMSSWQLYNTGNGMPAVRISELQINYYQNNLRAGTYGRGLWLSGLNCPSTANLTLSNTTNGDIVPPGYEFDEVSQNITSTAQITSYATLPDGTESQVIYRGGTDITLTPGFRANPGSNFYAFIHPCTSDYSSDPNSPNSVKINTGEDNENSSTSTMVQAINSIEGPHVSVYPNPNKGIFTAQLPDDEMSDIHVYSLLGSEVYTGSLLTNQVQIDLSTQPSGIYFYRATDSESGKLIGSGKVVIRK